MKARGTPGLLVMQPREFSHSVQWCPHKTATLRRFEHALSTVGLYPMFKMSLGSDPACRTRCQTVFQPEVPFSCPSAPKFNVISVPMMGDTTAREDEGERQ